MTIEEMKKRKTELGYSNARLSEISGVPIGTIQKIFSGETTAPRYHTIQALIKALSESEVALLRKPDASSSAAHDPMAESAHPDCLREPEPAYQTQTSPLKAPDVFPDEEGSEAKFDPDSLPSIARSPFFRCPPQLLTRWMKRGGKTITDYEALPDGTRVELIDGIFFDMASPTTIHQLIIGEVYHQLKECLDQSERSCTPFISPTDVQLDRDNRTIVQPDIFVICDRNQIAKARIVGAPAFVVEVVSPGNILTDILVKLTKYKTAGVREYWIIFPEARSVIVYSFDNSDTPASYSFEDSIPVSLSDGACQINLSAVSRQMDELFPE